MSVEAMRDPVRAWTRGAALLFTLALAACGGGGGSGDGEASAGSDSAAAAAEARTAAAGPNANCDPPPAATFQPVSGVPWSQVQAYLQQLQWADDSAAVGDVQLCARCTKFSTRVVSEARSYCTRKQDLAQLRAIGVMKALQPPTGQQPSGFGPQNKGDSLYLFARGDSAYVIYQARSQPNNPAGDTTVVAAGWSFHFCADGGHGTRSKAAAQWRPDTLATTTTQTRGKGEVGSGGGQLSYGWMACANGCCQFYGPPPAQQQDDPMLEKGNDPAVRGRPFDCPTQ